MLVSSEPEKLGSKVSCQPAGTVSRVGEAASVFFGETVGLGEALAFGEAVALCEADTVGKAALVAVEIVLTFAAAVPFDELLSTDIPTSPIATTTTVPRMPLTRRAPFMLPRLAPSAAGPLRRGSPDLGLSDLGLSGSRTPCS